MPFTKETAKELGRKGGKVKTSGVQEYLMYLASGAARDYYKKLQAQSSGTKLTDPEREFMDRFEKQTEFIAPKLARTELTGKDGGDLKIDLIQYDKKDSE